MSDDVVLEMELPQPVNEALQRCGKAMEAYGIQMLSLTTLPRGPERRQAIAVARQALAAFNNRQVELMALVRRLLESLHDPKLANCLATVLSQGDVMAQGKAAEDAKLDALERDG